MNIYIITENNFFFIGIKEQLTFGDWVVKKINPDELRKNLTGKFHKDDTFIFNPSNFSVDILPMIYLIGSPANNIFIPTKKKGMESLKLKNLPYLDTYITIDEIKKKIINNEYDSLKPYDIKNLLTKQEKTILKHTFNGLQPHIISRHMSISIKTVYSHRLKAIRKLGGRNLFDIWPLKGCLLLKTSGII